MDKAWVIMKLKNENTFLFLIVGVTLALIVGLTVGIVLSQNDRESLGSYERAIDLLEKYPLVDGLVASTPFSIILTSVPKNLTINFFLKPQRHCFDDTQEFSKSFR